LGSCLSCQGNSTPDNNSQCHCKCCCQSSNQDSQAQCQHKDTPPPAPPPATSKGAFANSSELLDPILLSQPLPDPSPGLSEDHLLPNIGSQLCAIIVDSPAQPQPVDSEESLPDQALQVTDALINSLIATFLVREHPLTDSSLPHPSTSNLDTNLQALFGLLETQHKVIDMNSAEGPSGLLMESIPLPSQCVATDINPNCLSQSQMLLATDCNNFVQAQQPKIEGLQNTRNRYIFGIPSSGNIPMNFRLGWKALYV